MRLLGTALAMIAMLSLMVSVAGAVYVSELLFIGAGTYDHDANPDPFGYGDFGAFDAKYNLSVRVPGEVCNWYFDPTLDVDLVGSGPARRTNHHIGMGENGIEVDGDLIPWGALGYSWEAGKGIYLGLGDASALVGFDPDELLGDYAWDLDGGGDDLAIQIQPSSSSLLAYSVHMRMYRSFSWLAGQPVTEWMAAWMSPFVGGIAMEGLDQGFREMAVRLGDWDTEDYDISYNGRMRVTGCDEAPVPEPVTLLLFGGGLLGTALLRRRR